MKILKIIFINILALLLLIIAFEVTYFQLHKESWKESVGYKKEMMENSSAKGTFDINYKLSPPKFNYIYYKRGMRKPSGLNYSKKPIILFGGSFTYGEGLKENETFSAKLSQLSKRPVYNRSICGWGLQHILYQLRRDDFFKEVKEPEYVIYTLIEDHYPRLFRHQFLPPFNTIVLRYKLKDNQFTEIPPLLSQIWGMYFIYELQYQYRKYFVTSKSNYGKNLEYIYKMLMESQRLLNNKYPNTKFVILIYSYKNGIFIDNPQFLDKLKRAGFIILDTRKLLKGKNLKTTKYTVADGYHPSEKAWDLIVPKINEKLNL